MRARVLGVAVGLVLGGSGWAAGPGHATSTADGEWPVTGPVVRPFAPPATRYGAGHRGADLAVPVGTPVRAAAAGRIAYAGLLAGRGVVAVVHGALRTTYEPVAAAVSVGDRVAAGAVLGRLTAGGHCVPGCLHWGLLRGDVYLDPVQLLRRGPSRLLPVAPEVTAQGPAPAVRRSAGPTAAPVILRPAAEPELGLRAASLPWGLGAAGALLAGLVLVRHAAAPTRPRRPPPQAAAGPRTPFEQPVDLATERSRRRIG